MAEHFLCSFVSYIQTQAISSNLLSPRKGWSRRQTVSGNSIPLQAPLQKTHSTSPPHRQRLSGGGGRHTWIPTVTRGTPLLTHPSPVWYSRSLNRELRLFIHVQGQQVSLVSGRHYQGAWTCTPPGIRRPTLQMPAEAGIEPGLPPLPGLNELVPTPQPLLCEGALLGSQL